MECAVGGNGMYKHIDNSCWTFLLLFFLWGTRILWGVNRKKKKGNRNFGCWFAVVVAHGDRRNGWRFQHWQAPALGAGVWSVSRVPLDELTILGSLSRLSDILSQIMSTSRSKTAWLRNNQNNYQIRSVWIGYIYLNVDVLLSRRFKELETQLIGKLLTTFVRNNTFVFHVALVTH